MESLYDDMRRMAKRMRLNALKMAFHAGANGAHLGGGLSCMEIFAVLYRGVLKYDLSRPEWPERDRFLVSKAHCVLAYYTALHEAGFITREALDSFEQNGTELAGHPVSSLKNGIEYSGGSLGMAFSVGLGMAIDAKRKGRGNKVYVLLGDGECDEGSNWEAFLSAPHFKLDNLTAIIDWNHLQYDGNTTTVMDLGSLHKKLEVFGWNVISVDGHDVQELYGAFTRKPISGAPCAIIADTIKGKGVSFMESAKEWHHGVLTEKLYHQALEEIS
ncbi:MAG: transketolase [Planctomycetia bacterium]|nr:transketolase [Planctomycetia bacterium]